MSEDDLKEQVNYWKRRAARAEKQIKYLESNVSKLERFLEADAKTIESFKRNIG